MHGVLVLGFAVGNVAKGLRAAAPLGVEFDVHIVGQFFFFTDVQQGRLLVCVQGFNGQSADIARLILVAGAVVTAAVASARA